MATQEAPPPTPPAKTRFGARSIASLLVFILAALLTIPALIGHWGYRTVLDSERYIDTVGPLINEPEVQQALATAVTERVVEKVDTESQVQTLLGNLFPSAGFTDQLAGPIASGINSLIGELVTKFVASDQFATVWIELNKAAQKGVVLVLEGREGGVVKLDGDNLVLDTSAALQAIQQHLVEAGITAAANVTIPESDREIVLANTPGLAQIRTIYDLSSPFLRWLPLIIALMFAGAILLARRRARTSVATGIVLLASGLLLLLGLGAGETVFANQLSGTPWAAAADVFWATLLDFLIVGVQALIVLGLVIILAGWFGGRTALAQKVRGHVTTGLAQLGGNLSGGRPGPMPRNMLGYAHWLIYAIGVAILLFSGVFSVSTVLWTSALVAGLITLAQLLAGPLDSEGPLVGQGPDVGAGPAAAAGAESSSNPFSGSNTIE